LAGWADPVREGLGFGEGEVRMSAPVDEARLGEFMLVREWRDARAAGGLVNYNPQNFRIPRS
jgi:hypothetical protein